MSHLDEELKKALLSPEGIVAQPGAKKPEPHRKRSIGLLIGLVLMGGTILTVVLTGIDNAAVYSKRVEQLLAERERFTSRNVRVLGTLVKGSLMRRSEPCEYRFKLSGGTKELSVSYPQCVIPDTFRDIPGVDVEVTAEGRLQPDGSFLAHQIMAKCPSKYDMKTKANSGYGAPHPMGPTSRLEDSAERGPVSPRDARN
jgi:cytochrome c-type biogenesis protein CcmE